jgi:hypothetical protein
VFALLLHAVVLLVAPPEQTSYLFTLEGLPAGQVTLQLSPDGTSFTYRSEQVFGRGPALRTVESRTLLVDTSGRVANSTATPVSLWLWTRHNPSCLEVMDERTGRTGQACSNALSGEELEGIALGQSFHAVYQEGVLEVLELGQARFQRLREAPSLDGATGLWAKGFVSPAGRGELGLEPPFSLPRQPAAPSPRGRAWAEGLLRDFGPAPTDERCLDSAQRLLSYLEERGGHGVLVLGLLLDAGRAWPHAWVRVEGPYAEAVDVDPAWGRLVPPGYLALEMVAAGGHGLQAGQAYLDLASQTRRLVRR